MYQKIIPDPVLISVNNKKNKKKTLNARNYFEITIL